MLLALKVMLLDAEVMLLHAEVMLLQSEALPRNGAVPVVVLVGNGEFELCKFLCGFGS